EMVETADQSLPILAPMSEAAGRISVLVGANYLRKDLGGQGILLSGLQGKNRGRVTILGIGHAGQAALEMAHGLGADVMAIDLNQKKLKAIQEKYSERLVTAPPDSEVIAAAVRESDLVIGAVLVPGKRPPLLVSRKVVGTMKPGSVIIDIAVDQGGCIETIRPTTHDAPAYVEEGVIHYAVTNMPALVPRSATQALTAASLPYLKKIARLGFEKAIHEDADLKKGIAIQNGTLKIENLF
ncbi:MAG: NAD(P)-dependent oxidoreductase, partial [bacterium]|nr:NAD(P)-dependent oxidoreductase [bacterium]